MSVALRHNDVATIIIEHHIHFSANIQFRTLHPFSFPPISLAFGLNDIVSLANLFLLNPYSRFLWIMEKIKQQKAIEENNVEAMEASYL